MTVFLYLAGVAVVLVLAGVLVVLWPWNGPRWARFWKRTSAKPIEELPLDDPDPTLRLIARLIVKVNIADSVNRRLRGLVLALVALVGLILIGLVVLGAVVVEVRHQGDQRDADKAQEAADSCASGNVVRTQINRGNDAKAAIVHALDTLQTGEIDGILEPLTTAGPTGDPRTDDFLARYTAGRSAVLAALADARAAIADARVEIRVCPDSPAPTSSTATGSG